MRPNRPQNALAALGDAVREVNAAVEEMRREHDPLASHIFVSRRQYQSANDTKSGKRREIIARLSFNTACELGFRGSLDEWPHGSSCEEVNVTGRLPDRWSNRSVAVSGVQNAVSSWTDANFGT
jgi:hypothetical protein